MRLLNVHDLDFAVFHSAIPKYAIASHRWTLGSEATIKDVRKKRNTDTIGYKKILGFAEYVKKEVPGVDWFWIDTCCINQDSSEEVAEAVNSMFKWYRAAELCIAYLADIKNAEDLTEFRNSQWFGRGWTLQELLAPSTVVFLTRNWQVIGHKGENDHSKDASQTHLGPSLEDIISVVTGIPESVLGDYNYSKAFSAEKKLEWMTDRETTREEDQSYCLLGLVDVNMPIIYGEGRDRARRRLEAEIANISMVLLDLQINQAATEKTPRSLHEAASSGDLEFITNVFNVTPLATEQLWQWDAGGALPLHRAVQNGHALVCKLLMTSMNRQTWDPIDLLDINGKSPIIYAFSETHDGSQDVIREFLTDEGLCFSVPTILTLRRSVLARILDIGGVDALQRAVAVMKRVLSPTQFANALQTFLPMAVTLPDSERLIPHFAVTLTTLHDEQKAALAGQSLGKITDTIYEWAIAERVKRFVLLHKAAGLRSFTGRDGLNFVGKAIVASDLTTLTLFHTIDSQLLSLPVGYWIKDGRTSRNPSPYGAWKPLRFAAFLGHPNTVRHVAHLSELEEDHAPHLRAVHFASLAAAEKPDSSNIIETWSFLRGLRADLEPTESEFKTVEMRVEFDSDWGMIMFPHDHEAIIEDVQSENPGRNAWDGGFVRAEGVTSYPIFKVRVKLRTAATGYPDNLDNLVHVDFMHGWNDYSGGGGKGRVLISPVNESDVLWFRESDQHHFNRLHEDSKLASGTNGNETLHNLRSWQLQCVPT